MERRPGDTRPLRKDPEADGLNVLHSPDEPLRLLPRHGEPFCLLEWVTQKTVKVVAYLPIYTAIIVTIVLLLEIFGIPFIKGA